MSYVKLMIDDHHVQWKKLLRHQSLVIWILPGKLFTYPPSSNKCPSMGSHNLSISHWFLLIEPEWRYNLRRKITRKTHRCSNVSPKWSYSYRKRTLKQVKEKRIDRKTPLIPRKKTYDVLCKNCPGIYLWRRSKARERERCIEMMTLLYVDPLPGRLFM